MLDMDAQCPVAKQCSPTPMNQNQNPFIRSYYRPRKPLLRPYLVAVAEANGLIKVSDVPKAGLRLSTYTTKLANWPITNAPDDIVV